MSCSNCNSSHIQNKKYNLCGECVFKKNNGGKSKAEVYQERADKKPKKVYQFKNKKISVPTSYTIEKGGLNLPMPTLDSRYVQDEVSRQNEINQNLAELEERRRLGKDFNLESFIAGCQGLNIEEEHKLRLGKKKKQKSIKKISGKQSVINAAYLITCIDMDHTTEPICTGCGKYQGGDIRLSHSHIISREDCKRIGRIDLISDRDNLTYHCMDFGMNKGCHGKHENPIERKSLLDYEKNMQYINSVSPEMYLKYTS